MGWQPSCLTCSRLLHSILFPRPIRCDYEMDYPRASRSSTGGSQARGRRLLISIKTMERLGTRLTGVYKLHFRCPQVLSCRKIVLRHLIFYLSRLVSVYWFQTQFYHNCKYKAFIWQSMWNKIGFGTN